MLERLFYYTKVFGLRGLICGVLGKISGRHIVMSLCRPDLRHAMFVRLPSTDADAYEQIFLDRAYDFKTRKTPAVIVDAGANIGLASIYFANRYPAAKILAIECEASNFDVLKLNAAPYPNILPIHAALWNHDGEVDIVDPGLGKWGFMTAAKSDAVASTSVRALTLASVMRKHDISHIDILKIDIEGAELEVFEASIGWIGDVDTIIAELHDRLKAGCQHTFAAATADFPERWQQGENVCVSRFDGCVVGHA